MKIRDIIGALEEFAPLPLQESYDNAGLQIGLTVDAESSGVLLCLDVNEDVIYEAKEKGCNLIVSHHPLIFHPPKKLTGADMVERCIILAIQLGINIYASHTNLDNALGGVNYKIAQKLGLTGLTPLIQQQNMPGAGSGLIGILPQPRDREDFIADVKEIFEVDCVRYNSWKGETISTVAVCGGAGAFLIHNAINAGADVFITGEIGYHRFFGYENNIQLMEIGHYESEQFTIDLLKAVIHDAFPQARVEKTEVETNPINYL